MTSFALVFDVRPGSPLWWREFRKLWARMPPEQEAATVAQILVIAAGRAAWAGLHG